MKLPNRSAAVILSRVARCISSYYAPSAAWKIPNRVHPNAEMGLPFLAFLVDARIGHELPPELGLPKRYPALSAVIPDRRSLVFRVSYWKEAAISSIEMVTSRIGTRP